MPTLRVDYVPGAAPLTIAGTSLADGQELGFATSLQLDIAGTGRLTLRSNRPAGADRDIEAAEARHRKVLERLGVESLAAARQRQAAAQRKAGEIELARQRLIDLAPQGIAQLQAEIARLAEASAGALELKGDPAALREAHAAAERHVETTRNGARQLQPALSAAANALVGAETALAGALAEELALNARLGPLDGRPARQAALAEDAARQLAAHDQAQARVAQLRPLAHDLAAAETSLRRLRSVAEAAGQAAGQLRETLADLNGFIHARADSAVEETWQETADALATANASVARFETEVAVLDRLRKSLVAARSAARDLYLKPVVTQLRPLLGLLFDDISITFDEETLLPQTVRRNGQDEEVDRLSGGMREQLSILTRLAFARLLAQGGRAAPVILDDALVYSDDDRIERMFDALHSQARDQQILVFSCRQRAFARLGGNVLRMQPWVPG